MRRGAGSPGHSLDFLSREFDALRALYEPNLQPPDPSAPLLDNLHKCRSLLPEDHPESIPHRSATGDEARKAAREQHKRQQLARTGVRQQREAREALRAPLLQRVMDVCAHPGPFDVLRAAQRAGAKVKVVLRHAGGVSGVAMGRVVAYDKHMNLVLRDVVEVSTVRVRTSRRYTTPGRPDASDAAQDEDRELRELYGLAPEGGEAPPVQAGGAAGVRDRVRWGWRLERRTKRPKQILVRGDCVVIVTPAAAAEPGRGQQEHGTRSLKGTPAGAS
ncbi:unnamed protein product [Pedinophyceae sp. YPF-701]|nr:unnamed protein product [Pedinophyceae sp. YPF-701]